MLKRAAILAILVAAWPRPGLCDWEYTRWGMTIEQVKSASVGDATDNPSPEDESTVGEEASLIGRFSADGFDYKVYFMFERRTKRLAGVSLHLLDQAKGQALYDYLVKKYGRPYSRLNTRMARIARWIDREHHDNIAWSALGPAGGTVRFSEFRESGRNL